MDKDQKKVMKAALKQFERQKNLSNFPISVSDAEALLDFLDSALKEVGCNSDYKHTLLWCAQNDKDSVKIIPWVQANGGYCDCEILSNLEDHIEEAKKA